MCTQASIEENWLWKTRRSRYSKGNR